MVDNPELEITMQSQLSEIAAIIEKLYADPGVRSRIKGREASFVIAMREALANAVSHCNHHDASKKVSVRYICAPNNALSIVVRDEGKGFDLTELTPPSDKEDQRRGISLMRSCMDEVQFRKNGTEAVLSLKGRS